ncbi:unnamed protein product [Didymodactylos carnosus]|uniref:HNH Cas9-type domain-containing protein n=1 Tax=Didymodactylos carnosus TaxID=1234261 RepID=A0A8S2GKT5_9BILA|nr:unnamed protein product [Didymodactylos carnosus]CAF3532367.1 unnamed protein product [Didymodactylos carnosus]
MANLELVNQIAKICQNTNQDQNQRTNLLTEFLKQNFDQTLKIKNAFNMNVPNEHASFSEKALKELNTEFESVLEVEPISLLVARKRNESRIENKNIYEGKYLPKDLVDTDFMPKAVKRSYRQAVKVINALWKKYGIENITNVAIELAREISSDEQAEKARDLQALNLENKALLQKYGIEFGNGRSGRNSELTTKLILHIEQHGLDLYTGQKLPEMKEIVNDPNLVEIDHILPISLSFKDSRSNKTLTLSGTNRRKGQLTPFAFLNRQGLFQAFEQRVIDSLDHNRNMNLNYKYRKNKKANFLFLDDLNSPHAQQEFASRQLVDTRYATSLMLNQLHDFVKTKGYEMSVQPINGLITALFRKEMGLQA